MSVSLDFLESSVLPARGLLADGPEDGLRERPLRSEDGLRERPLRVERAFVAGVERAIGEVELRWRSGEPILSYRLLRTHCDPLLARSPKVEWSAFLSEESCTKMLFPGPR